MIHGSVRVCQGREVRFKRTFQPPKDKRTFSRIFLIVPCRSILANLATVWVLEVVDGWQSELLVYIYIKIKIESAT